jgi:hypothetical protein
LNLDLALPHWRNASARIPATKGAAWYPTAHACATSDINDSSRPEIEPWHEQSINQASKQSKSKSKNRNQNRKIENHRNQDGPSAG